MNNTITAIILAAGMGTRMKSSKAKVLHEVFFKPMLHHVLDAVEAGMINETVVIIGHQHAQVAGSLGDYGVTTVIQEEQLGTGHAVLCAEQNCADSDTVMILCGDTPLIRSETLDSMIRQHQESSAHLTLMTTEPDDPFGYGRVISNAEGHVLEIVEQKDATGEQLNIGEINAGIYLAERRFLFNALKEVGTDNSQGEMYLTDIVAIANRHNRTVRKFVHPNAIDVLGINSRVELARAHQELQRRRNRELMLSGITMYSPETIFVAHRIPVGRDTVIHPGVQITGSSTIGIGCLIEPGAVLHNCRIGNNAVIGAHAVLRDCSIGASECIAPQTQRDE